ncbi:MAG TPA: HmuY family protein [Gemmatimonadaceae bacterium]|nr:HmuY family protein [Gemmatimonadaceae bacterium]
MTTRSGLAAPLPLLILFGLFLAAIAYLVSASLVRRDAPVFSATPPNHTRGANWERVGDTLTVDASDGDRWVYVSFAQGRVLVAPDTAGWDVAVQRYRVITPPAGAIADLGTAPFASGAVLSGAPFVSTTGDAQRENDAIKHWYRYNMLTHLLEPNGHVFAVRAPSGALWKVAVLSYYCPKLQAGCLTMRYAPMLPAP